MESEDGSLVDIVMSFTEPIEVVSNIIDSLDVVDCFNVEPEVASSIEIVFSVTEPIELVSNIIESLEVVDDIVTDDG